MEHEKIKELKHFFEMEIELRQEDMKIWYNPYFNGVDVGNDNRMELIKGHIRFCKQVLKMIEGD